MRPTIIFNGKRFVVVGRCGGINSRFSHVTRAFVDFSTTRQTVPCRNCSVLISTFRVSNFNGATDRASENKDVTSDRGVVPTFPKVNMSKRRVVVLQVRRDVLAPNRRLVYVALVKCVVCRLVHQ